jgi:hypothetical protein
LAHIALLVSVPIGEHWLTARHAAMIDKAGSRSAKIAVDHLMRLAGFKTRSYFPAPILRCAIIICPATTALRTK